MSCARCEALQGEMAVLRRELAEAKQENAAAALYERMLEDCKAVIRDLLAECVSHDCDYHHTTNREVTARAKLLIDNHMPDAAWKYTSGTLDTTINFRPEEL